MPPTSRITATAPTGPSLPPAPLGKDSACVRGGTGGVTSREIWALTWPQALMMFFQFLVGFTDVVVAGRINAQVQGALGLITQCQFFLLVLGIAMVNGGVAAMSQALGARLPLRAERYVGLIFKLAAGLCVLTLVLGILFRREMLVLLGVPEEIFPLTLDLWVLFLGIMPSSYLSMTTVAIFRARKNVWIPLMSGIVVCVLNAVGDFGLGLGWFGLPNLGGRGLVWSSIASVTAGALFNLIVLLRSGLISRRSFASWRWERRAMPYILKVALPAGGSQILWNLGYMVLFLITNTLPQNSVVALAGLTAGLRIEAILFLPGFAFNMTASVLVGHCLGAGNPSEAKRVGLRVVVGGACIMSLVAACMFPFLNEITGFVAPDPQVQGIATSYMMFNLFATPFTVASMILGGVFSGAGATIYSMVVFSCSTWLVRLPLAWYMGHIMWQSASGIFLAMLVSQIVQATASLYVLLRRDWYRFASTAKRFKREHS